MRKNICTLFIERHVENQVFRCPSLTTEFNHLFQEYYFYILTKLYTVYLYKFLYTVAQTCYGLNLTEASNVANFFNIFQVCEW